MRVKAQRGFTLLEIVIVVLIVGLILAGVVKGQEMITSAKVKRVSGQLDEIRAAFLGFEDRFKAIPGDYAEAALTLDCGGPCLRGNGNGRIRSNETPVGGNQVHEDLLVWTHLAASGLLKGDYRMVDGQALATESSVLKNPFGAYMHVAFDGWYGINDGGTRRHNLKTGAQVPVEVVAELDRKTDDGLPYGGSVQFSSFAANSAPGPTEGGAGTCTTSLGPGATWDLASGSSNCGVAILM